MKNEKKKDFCLDPLQLLLPCRYAQGVFGGWLLETRPLWALESSEKKKGVCGWSKVAFAKNDYRYYMYAVHNDRSQNTPTLWLEGVSHCYLHY